MDLSFITELLQQLMEKQPALASALFAIGILRVVIKPLMSVAQAYVDFTPDAKDNEKLAAILDSKIAKTVIYALDWLASIKIGPKK